ncbi:hypothetical protein EW146_g9422 [Bondarzewia mesenterica]|uniref:DNA (cytosine-5-)-methyltransferase n=1 Tax=Bondarzewia mesenterica TaxID=1095465 RepID=A0A4S4L6Y9_9AGAM|nr:hypothetical protein EW146_g9422 [Bondarzewia mesenterica]
MPNYARWCTQSPDHFYVRFHFPDLKPISWALRKSLQHEDLYVCIPCFQARFAHVMRLREYEKETGKKPLRIFDPFAGVGAFSLSLESVGGMQTTHAIEISPSAAITLKNNSPSTTVYNQCSNEVLRYAIRRHELGSEDVLRDLRNKKPLPPPPKPGDFDCIAAGFPCQPHSTLNRFQKANDVKSHLILNLLSWVDFLRPKYCVFENVEGFLRYRPKATQMDSYRVEGGIEMGGLRFLVHAMLTMNYQVRFALLQAGHYGAPQTRVRFFLIAAKQGHVLPDFPQPTHDFPQGRTLEIKFPNGHAIRPITTAKGTAPFPFVTIDDAISDLPRENPKYIRDPTKKSSQDRERARTFPAIRCEKTRSVVNIPLEPNADYRTLPQHLWRWQFANPVSAIARGGFRPGMYGRLDQDGFFHTTVTNVTPTAKQSFVLHPYIGNAVAWPVGAALGRELKDAAFKKWLQDREDIIYVE